MADNHTPNIGKNTFWAKVEAINFDQTIFDTEDLSCIRGSSHAIRIAVENIGNKCEDYETIYAGASEALLKITRVGVSSQNLETEIKTVLKTGNEDKLSNALAHLFFNVAVLKEKGEEDYQNNPEKLLAHLSQRLAYLRFNQLNLSLPAPPNTKQICEGYPSGKGALAFQRPVCFW
jgi:hypothetical protein